MDDVTPDRAYPSPVRVRTGIIAVLALMTFVLLAGFSDNGSPSSTFLDRPNPAQPVPAVAPIRQGDRCDVFGSTAVNEKGESFDCEPWGDGVNRWIYP